MMPNILLTVWTTGLLRPCK